MRLSLLPALAGLVALAAPLVGCGDVGPSPASPTSGPIKPMYGGVKIVPVGTEQVTGPYQVTLSNDGGDGANLMKFTARITHKGQPLDKGFVTLAVTPPGATLEDHADRMQKTGPGTYQLALPVNTEAAGESLAKVTVVGLDSTDPAYFSFSAG